MQLAHIVPAKYLDRLPLEQTAYLALSNLVVANPMYRNFHWAQSSKGNLVILDNPVHENLEPHITDWELAIKLIKPTVAVVPDCIESSEKTQMLARWSLRQTNGAQCEFMGVPHGNSDDEFLDCARELVGLGCTWLGVSLERRLNNDRIAYATRCRRISMLNTYHLRRGIKLHLLGVSEEGREFTDKMTRRVVSSADTSKYAVHWLTGNPVLPPVPTTTPYPGRAALGGSMGYFNYVGGITDDFTDNLRDWVQYAETAPVQVIQ